jgi:hypothetical protein
LRCTAAGALTELPFALRAAGLIRAWGGPARSLNYPCMLFQAVHFIGR